MTASTAPRGVRTARPFMMPQLDKPIYVALQTLRAAHGGASQWEIIQAALVSFASLPPTTRQEALEGVRRAPSDQPGEYPVA